MNVPAGMIEEEPGFVFDEQRSARIAFVEQIHAQIVCVTESALTEGTDEDVTSLLRVMNQALEAARRLTRTCATPLTDEQMQSLLQTRTLLTTSGLPEARRRSVFHDAVIGELGRAKLEPLFLSWLLELKTRQAGDPAELTCNDP